MSTEPDDFGFAGAAAALRDEPTQPAALDISAFRPGPKPVDRSVADAARRAGAERGFHDRQPPPAPTASPIAATRRRSAGRKSRGSVQQPGTISISGELSVLDAFARRARWERMTQAVLIERMLESWEAEHGPIDRDFE